jgi:hypothetical protein
MSIQEMAVENAEKRLKQIDKLDFAISAWADYDNGLTQGFKDGAEAMLEKACQWLHQYASDYAFSIWDDADDCSVSEDLIEDFKRAMEE